MIRTARVHMEFVFHEKRIPKQVLEEMCMSLSHQAEILIKPFMQYDQNLHARVYYDDLSGTPNVSIMEVMPRPNLMRLFNLGRKKDVKAEV